MVWWDRWPESGCRSSSGRADVSYTFTFPELMAGHKIRDAVYKKLTGEKYRALVGELGALVKEMSNLMFDGAPRRA